MSAGNMAPWIVIKLGGTSVSSRGNWDNALAAVREQLDAGKRVLLVQSAFAGVTNALEALLAAAEAATQEERLADIARRHTAMAKELEVDANAALAPHLERLQRLATGALLTGEVTPRVRAEVLAGGELMASAVCVLYLQRLGLPARWADARELLVASPLPNQSPAGQYLSAACDYTPNPAFGE